MMQAIKPKILLVAFACRPNAGTEYGVGWHFYRELARLVDLYLLTEAGYANEIKKESAELGFDTSKIHFIDIGQKARDLCNNQGSWSFYYYYRKWQLEALQVARQLNSEIAFDLVHHLNMIGFREPGFMYRLGIPFVIGPLGGFGNIPYSYSHAMTPKAKIKEFTKIVLNFVNMFFPRIRTAIKSANAVIAAVPEAKQALSRFFGVASLVVPETGCLPFSSGKPIRKDLLWVGKEVDRKMFIIAAEAFCRSSLRNNEKFFVIGSFCEATIKQWSSSQIVFLGNIPHKEVVEFMGGCRALLFPSVHEGNPHVIFEAISRATPVICHDSYGMGYAITDKTGIKIPVSGMKESIENFSKAIDRLPMLNFEERSFRGFCDGNSWGERAGNIYQVYLRVLHNCSN